MEKPKSPPEQVPARKQGGQTVYTEEVAGEILERLAGGESLKAICSETRLPAESTVVGWFLDDVPPGFAERYTRARKAQAEHFAEEQIEVARTEPDPARAKIIGDALRWFASKVAPGRFGERVKVDGNLGLTLVDHIKAAREAAEGEG